MEEGSAVHEQASFREPRVVELSAAEMEFLLRVCLKHRSQLPTYLQSTKPELELIEGILKKLA